VSAERELLRQRLMLRTLWQRDGDDALQGWLRPMRPQVQAERGVAVYRANAAAAIERALHGSHPTVRAVVGDKSFALLARAYWRAHPPRLGDLAWTAEGLPGFIADSPMLADVPYLADVARLDAALDAAERASDEQWRPDTLTLLGERDPGCLYIDLLPGTQVLSSAYPVLTIREAHAAQGDDPFGPARKALAAGRGEHVLVWRAGYQACACAVDLATAQWTRALLRGESLAQALDACAAFDFERWLAEALRQGWMARVRSVDTPLPETPR
jgi:hypothetical protein